MTTDTVVADDVLNIELKELKVREDQKHRLANKAKIEELAKSIDEVGILHNLVTDPEGNICSGTRRFGALTFLKWDRPVPVRRVSKELADAIVLAANYPVESPDPMHDSEIVHQLTEKGWSVKEIATTIGWDPRRVALLKQLQNLCDEAKKALADSQHYMRDWPVEWIEEFASAAPEAQREALEKKVFQYVRDKGQFDHILGQFFRVLGKAPWKLDDATLVPTAGKDGTCVTCPDQSQNTPFLFDEMESGGDIKKAVCQNVSCWLAKANACAARKIADLREKNAESVIVAHHGARDVLPVLKEHPTFMEHQVVPCQKSEKGAVPALIVRGDGSMEQKYVRKPVETATAGKGPRAAAAPKEKVEISDAEREKLRKEKLEARRKQWIVSHIITQIREWGDRKPPSYETILGLVASYRVDHPLTEGGLPRSLHGNVKVRKELFESAEKGGTFVENVWPRVQTDVIQSISPLSRGVEALDDEYDEAIWVADLLKLGVEREFRVLAEQAVPTPKSMQPKESKAPKKAKGKKAAPKPKKKGARAEDGFAPDKDD